MAATPLTVGAVLYPGFEMLDMFGPLEMFSLLGPERVAITMLAESSGPVASALSNAVEGGPRVAPDRGFDDAEQIDILLVPGGVGTLPQLQNPVMLSFLQRQAAGARHIASVCTGSLLLARAGLLDNRRATTNKQFFALSANETAPVQWVEAARWVEDGPVFTSSGVSAGMDMTLALISQVWGQEAAEAAAAGAEYSWHRDADSDPFIAHLNEGAREMGLVE